MAIETYLIEDSEKMIAEPEHLEEWTKTVEALDLKGQKELYSPEKSPVPFPQMNEVQERVYNTLCPSKHDVKTYNRSTIPLRVLSLIALSQKENYFHKIEIWSDEKDPDPIAVGYLNDKYSSPKCIIARWGDELRAFAELVQIAKKKWLEQRISKLKKSVAESQQKLATAENDAELYFQGEYVSGAY